MIYSNNNNPVMITARINEKGQNDNHINRNIVTQSKKKK